MISINIVVLIIILSVCTFIGAMVGFNLNTIPKDINSQIDKIDELMNDKVQELSEWENELKEKEKSLESDDSKKLEFTRDILEFIDGLINIELINYKRFDILLESISDNKKPKIDIDNAIQEISNNVFHAIKPEIYDSSYSLITKEYLMSYIQKRTIMVYISYINNDVSNKL